MKKLERNKVYMGNCLEVLKTFPDESLDMCITSPPYWGLRDYGTEGQIWGGDPDCEHDFQSSKRTLHSGTWGEKDNVLPHFKKATKLNWQVEDKTCNKCGAWKGELGLEPSPEMFINNLCDIFDEIKRCLKPHGSCWVNLGDSYVRNPSQQDQSGKTGIQNMKYQYNFKHKKNYGSTYKSKSLVQIPSRFAIEMTSRGWILRNEIIWHKPSCLPASVTDRYTVDYEKMFFFTKNPKYYFKQQIEETKDLLQRNKRTVWHVNTASFKGAHFAVYPPQLLEGPLDATCPRFVDKKTGKAREITIEKKSIERHELPTDNPNYRPARYDGKYTQGQRFAAYYDKGYTDGRDDDEFIPGVVLDPFFGSGTTAEVAMKQGKDWVGIELNEDFEKISRKRLEPTKIEKKTRDKSKEFWN
jgi:site-specific DNA-methyltransferase (adenine-specific)